MFQKNVLLVVYYFVIVITIFSLVKFGLDQKEKAECLKWKQQAKEFADFYLVDWQKAQCEARGINIIINYHD